MDKASTPQLILEAEAIQNVSRPTRGIATLTPRGIVGCPASNNPEQSGKRYTRRRQAHKKINAGQKPRRLYNLVWKCRVNPIMCVPGVATPFQTFFRATMVMSHHQALSMRAHSVNRGAARGHTVHLAHGRPGYPSRQPPVPRRGKQLHCLSF